MPLTLCSALSFLLVEGAYDKAYEWTQLTAAERSSIKQQYAVSKRINGFCHGLCCLYSANLKAAGIKLIVAVFGATDVPTSSGFDPVATANTMAAWVKQYDLDGIDVDYEVRNLTKRVCRFSLKRIVRRTSML